MKRILALDLGEKNIGVAISDEMGLLARPFTTLKNGKQVFGEIAEILDKNDCEKLVIGLPLSLSGKEEKQVEKIRDFSRSLEGVISVKIEFRDERFTTKLVEKRLINEGVSAKRRKELIDQMAAREILQDYLDENDKERY